MPASSPSTRLAPGVRGRGRPGPLVRAQRRRSPGASSPTTTTSPTEALRFLAQESGEDAVRRLRRAPRRRARGPVCRAAGRRRPRHRRPGRRPRRRPDPRRLRRLGPPGGRAGLREPVHRHTALPGALPRPARGSGISRSSATLRPRRSRACSACTCSAWRPSPTATTCAPPSSPPARIATAPAPRHHGHHPHATSPPPVTTTEGSTR